MANVLYNLKTIHLVSCYQDHNFDFFHVQRKKVLSVIFNSLTTKFKKESLRKKCLIVRFAMTTNLAQCVAALSVES